MSVFRGGAFDTSGVRDYIFLPLDLPTRNYQVDRTPPASEVKGVRLTLADELEHTIYDTDPNIPFWDF